MMRSSSSKLLSTRVTNLLLSQIESMSWNSKWARRYAVIACRSTRINNLYQPPDLEIRDIGELTTEQFRGIFRLTYAGDAYIVLRTKVQVCAGCSALPYVCRPPLLQPSYPCPFLLIKISETSF